MRSGFGFPVILCLGVLGAAPAIGQPEPVRPAWAASVRGWGEFDVPAKVGKRDLERIDWHSGLAVAQDGHDNVYVFSPGTGLVRVFAPNGDQRDEWKVERWEPVDAVAIFSGFATDTRGDAFAFASRGRVFTFSREEVPERFEVPTFVTGLALLGDEVLLARVPMQFGAREPGKDPFIRKECLLSRVGAKGEALGDALAPDKAEGTDAFSLAMTQDIALAVDKETSAVWVADRHRVYRLRRLSSGGHVESEWSSDRVKAGVQTEGEAPAALEGYITKEAVRGYRPIKAPMVVRAVAARRGFAYVLTGAGPVAEFQVVDVFSGVGDGPAWRLALRVADGTTYGQLGVTENGFWLFPAGSSGHPHWVERVPDSVMEQSMPRETAQSAAP